MTSTIADTFIRWLRLIPSARRKLQLSSRANPIDRWIQTRLSMDHAGNIPARNAYADFCRWARAMDIEPGSETRFGRDFSARIIGLGGVKVKRRDRAYYHGVALSCAETSGAPRS